MIRSHKDIFQLQHISDSSYSHILCGLYLKYEANLDVWALLALVQVLITTALEAYWRLRGEDEK
jgi:hypothetical protein